MGCASSLPASSIEVPSSWSSLIQAETIKPHQPAVQRLLAKLLPLVQSVEALPPCKERDTLLRQTWTVRVQSATWNEEAAEKATKNKDWPLMLRCQAACVNKLNEAADKLSLYIAEAPEKAIAQEAAAENASIEKANHKSMSAALEARLAALKAAQNPHDE